MRMIEVRRFGTAWRCRGPWVGWSDDFATSEDALQDAWRLCGGDVPALIFT